jgi:predicted anti-sigma-YlaC factor YlaD
MVYLKCTHTIEKISEIIDAEASFVTRLRFYGHLMMCSKCRQYFSQFKILKRTTVKVLRDDLPEDFDHVMDFVMDEIEGKASNKKFI